MPTISIIILTYNREALLLETLQSVFTQSYTDYEIIILDDGSTDKTRQRIEELDHPAICYHYTKHLGNLSQLRNLAWKYAKGEFIAFLDADDIWLPKKLEQQLELIRTDEQLAFVYTDVEEFNAQEILRSGIYKPFQAEWTSAAQFELTLSGQMPIYASTVLIRRALAEKLGGFEDSLILGDTHYLLRLAQQHPCQVIFEPLVRIRKHDQNISVYQEREAYIEMLSLLRVFEREQSLGKSAIHKYKAFYYRQLAQFDRRQGKWLPALQAYGKTLVHSLRTRVYSLSASTARN